MPAKVEPLQESVIEPSLLAAAASSFSAGLISCARGAVVAHVATITSAESQVVSLDKDTSPRLVVASRMMTAESAPAQARYRRALPSGPTRTPYSRSAAAGVT